MIIIQQILFILLLGFSVSLFAKNIHQIRNNILLGRQIQIYGTRTKRWKNVLFLALGQKKMFKNWIPAVLHIFVFSGFLIINVEVLEIILDGITGKHREFKPLLGPTYNILISSFELLAVLVILACSIFLIRRNILRLPRFHKPEMKTWPRTDANIILLVEIALMLLFLTMNCCDLALQTINSPGYIKTGPFLISNLVKPLFSNLNESDLIKLERWCWWLHISGILAFLNYLPYSKHLHILLAFPNTYFRGLEPPGKMNNIPEIQNEAQVLLGITPIAESSIGKSYEKLGALDINDLNWKNLLDAYSCTECGRCTAACPANMTGKLLSPRKIMMDTRDRMEEIGKIIRKQQNSKIQDKTLLFHYISEEELRACTSCGACVEECPISINPLDIIYQLRRYLVLEAAKAPKGWNSMFSNMENNQAPWQYSNEERENWTL